MKTVFFKCTLFSILFSLLLMIISGCGSSSNLPMGFEQNITQNDHPVGTIQKATYYPTRSGFYEYEVPTGASSYLYVGENEGFRSIMVLRFGFTGMSRPDSSVIESVKLILFPGGVIGDSTSQLTLRTHRIGDLNPEWDELLIKPGLFANDYRAEELSEPAVVIGTQTDSVVFELRVAQFTNANGFLDSSFVKNGLCVIPESNVQANLIRQFYSDDFGTSALEPRLEIVSTFEGETDTTEDYYATDAFLATPKELNSNAFNNLFIGSGVSYRSLLNFNVSDIPDNATINRARLILCVNNEYSIPGVSDNPGLYVYPATSWPDVTADVEIDSSSGSYPSTVDEDTVTVELGLLYQKITNNQYEYPGLFMRSQIEASDIRRYSIYGREADSLRMPRLILEYTIPPAFPN